VDHQAPACVIFHDGKDFIAADVLYHFQRIVSNKFSGAHGLGLIDLKNTKALDAHTIPGVDV